MKKGMAVLFTVILMTSTAACQKDAGEEIQKRYGEMESYTAVVDLTVTGNKGMREYQLSQSFREPEHYRTEIVKPEHLKGTVSVIDEDKVWFRTQGAPAIELERSSTELPFDVMSVADFFDAYFASEAPELELTETQAVLKIPFEDGTQALQLSLKTWMPECLLVFDSEGKERCRLDFIDFVLDAKVADGVFVP